MGKIYAGLLILENWRAKKTGKPPEVGFFVIFAIIAPPPINITGLLTDNKLIGYFVYYHILGW